MQTKEEAMQFLADYTRSVYFRTSDGKKVIEVAIPKQNTKKGAAFGEKFKSLVKDYIAAQEKINSYKAIIAEINDESIPVEERAAAWREFNAG